MSLMPDFPLARGILSGKYRRGAAPAEGTRLANTKSLAEMFLNEANIAAADKRETFAHHRLAASPCLASIIAGAGGPGNIDQNIAAARDWLTPVDMSEIDAPGVSRGT